MSMSKCETCEEKNDVTITEIKIEGVGYYDWCRDILYCPTCGKKITHKQKGDKQ
jgi:NADH pyrophosphatase NudC (nudix superfamily)